MRHSEPRWDLVTTMGLKGWGVDLVPLTERGIEQSKKVVSGLKKYDLARIVSSPMTRCLQTASIVGFGLGIEVCVGFNLHEWIPDLSFSWTTYEEVNVLEASMVENGGEWSADKKELWEPLSQVRARALAAIEAHKTERSLLIITHGMVIQSLTGKRVDYSEIVKL